MATFTSRVEKSIDAVIIEIDKQVDIICKRKCDLTAKRIKEVTNAAKLASNDAVLAMGDLPPPPNQELDDLIGDCFKTLVESKTMVLLALEEFNIRLRYISATNDQNPWHHLHREICGFRNWYECLSKCVSTLETSLLNYRSQHSEAWNSQLKTIRDEMVKTSLLFTGPPNKSFKKGDNLGRVSLQVLPFAHDSLYILSWKEALVNQETVAHLIRTEFQDKELPASAGVLNCSHVWSTDTIIYRQMEALDIWTSPREKGGTEPTKCGEDEDVLFYWLYFRVRVEATWNKKREYFTLHTISIPMALMPSEATVEADLWPERTWIHGWLADVPKQTETMTWKRLVEVVDGQFRLFGRRLSTGNKNYLRARFGIASDDGMISRRQLCSKTDIMKDDKRISLGQWIYYCVDLLLSSQLIPEWRAGKILGFISKPEMQHILNMERAHTLILGFSESRPHHIGLYKHFYPGLPVQGEALIKHTCSQTELAEIPLNKVIQKGTIWDYLYSNYNVEEFGNVAAKKKAFPEEKELQWRFQLGNLRFLWEKKDAERN